MKPRPETYAERDKRLRKEAEERRKKEQKKEPKKVKPLTALQRRKVERLVEKVNEAQRGPKSLKNVEIR